MNPSAARPPMSSWSTSQFTARRRARTSRRACQEGHQFGTMLVKLRFESSGATSSLQGLGQVPAGPGVLGAIGLKPAHRHMSRERVPE